MNNIQYDVLYTKNISTTFTFLVSNLFDIYSFAFSRDIFFLKPIILGKTTAYKEIFALFLFSPLLPSLSVDEFKTWWNHFLSYLSLNTTVSEQI